MSLATGVNPHQLWQWAGIWCGMEDCAVFPMFIFFRRAMFVVLLSPARQSKLPNMSCLPTFVSPCRACSACPYFSWVQGLSFSSKQVIMVNQCYWVLDPLGVTPKGKHVFKHALFGVPISDTLFLVIFPRSCVCIYACVFAYLMWDWCLKLPKYYLNIYFWLYIYMFYKDI